MQHTHSADRCVAVDGVGAQVETVRDDGVLVVKMAKFEAIAYLQQSQVKLVPRPRPTGPAGAASRPPRK